MREQFEAPLGVEVIPPGLRAGTPREMRNQTTAPAQPEPDEASPHDGASPEPLGPLTRDDLTPLGDTPEAHDEISPHDLPLGHPGRRAAERQAAAGDGTTRGDI